MRVMGKRILVKQTLTDEVSKGGIVMAGDQQALPYGEIIQIGPELDEGFIQVGDIVLFTTLGAIELKIKKDHVLIEVEDVLAILDEEEDLNNADS